jgi:PH (Pleckstrin Homology) domain-containing protein/putative oligomerization/nucleic acid binding protein
MPFKFGKKDSPIPPSFITNITDKEDLEEIRKIANMLNPNEEVLVVARQSRLKPGGSKMTPNIVFGTDRRIIIKDPHMLGMREEIIDIPYDMITGVKLDKGIFSSSIIFNAPGLISSSRLRNMEKLTDREDDENNNNISMENGVITAIPKEKAEDLIEVIRNGMDKIPEQASSSFTDQQKQQNYRASPTTSSSSISIADELTKLAKLKEQGVISESEFQKMKQDLINRI